MYAFEAVTGRQLWRFRAAPAERRIHVHGRLLSNWPVGSGVLVEGGVVYAATGVRVRQLPLRLGLPRARAQAG